MLLLRKPVQDVGMRRDGSEVQSFFLKVRPFGCMEQGQVGEVELLLEAQSDSGKCVVADWEAEALLRDSHHA